MAVVAGVLLYVSRIGFDNYGLLIIKSILISFFLIHTPQIINAYIVRKISKEWYFSKAFILLLCIVLLILAGQIRFFLNIDLSYLFILLGGIAFITAVIGNNKGNYNRTSFWLYMLFLLIGVWAVSVYTLSSYHHPLIKEKIITGAFSHRDVVWHAAMAGMFKTHLVSSTGLDGLVPIYYHILSHFIYGSYSNLLDISTLTFYNINVPILIVPLFFLAFIFCVKDASEYFSFRLNINSIDETNIKYWILFSMLFVLPLPQRIIGYLDGERYQYLISPSYSIALLLTFIFFSILFSFLNRSKDEKMVMVSNKIFLTVTSILLFLAISLSKVSFLFVLGSIYGYVFLRLKYYKNGYHILTMAGFVGVVAIVYYIIINTETFLKNPYQINSHDVSLVGYILYMLPSLIYILLKTYSIKIRTLRNIYEKIKTAEILDIEILVLLIIILFPLPFQYFKGIQIYLAYILILSHMNLFIDSLLSNKPFPVKQ